MKYIYQKMVINITECSFNSWWKKGSEDENAIAKTTTSLWLIFFITYHQKSLSWLS